MITFTKEQLIASAHARIEFAEMMLAGELEPLKERTWSIELELARIALASLEAEPVAYVSQSNLDALKRGHNDVFVKRTDDVARPVALYTAPPAPVSAPDESAVESLATDLMRRIDKITGERHSVATLSSLRVSIVDACRAALLQGAAGNSPVIPDGWVLVPVDATRAMIDAAARVEEDGYDAMHKAMIEAAPPQ
ncbi:hypothetical protein CWI88_09975 [Enterobacter cancerogenus]|uniref:hypothetical protein n=1 Tax=Enterobacter cancerogenus TaxID=69218 RepID=UPI000C771D32|nr:hypothetical protein [Enterobacter cancerogenus]AUJ81348.1 hypothetical protein CWI88_09975 [Enterobacter cancerogenus]